MTQEMDIFEAACEAVSGDAFETSGWTSNENCIEWLRGQQYCTVTFCQKRYINRVRKYAEEYPDKVQIVSDRGNTVVAHVPVQAVRIYIPSPRDWTEEEKQAAIERLAEARAAKEEARLAEARAKNNE